MASNVNIFCDVDGVLADFIGAACEMYWKPRPTRCSWHFYRDWGMTDEDFWACVSEAGEMFATDLEVLPGAVELVESLRYEGHVRFLTAPWRHPEAWSGRVKWLREHFQARFDEIILCPSKLKGMLARCGDQRNILIDDYEDNVSRWCRAGGVGFLWPGPSGALHDCGLTPKERTLAIRRAIRRFRDHGVVTGPASWTRS